MPPVSTQAVVLHSFSYSESSKIVRLATRELGVQSAIAKGALRQRSKFGAKLQGLSEGVAQLYVKPNRELHTLSEYDVTRQRVDLARDVRRYAAASALAELVMRTAPAEQSLAIYGALVEGLNRLEMVAEDEAEAESLLVMWRMVAELGFTPEVDECVRDGLGLPSRATTFSIADGGFLCASCASGVQGIRLGPEDRATLRGLVAGELVAPNRLSPRHAAAHRRLLARFVRRHVAEEHELKALTFWETLSWKDTL